MRDDLTRVTVSPIGLAFFDTISPPPPPPPPPTLKGHGISYHRQIDCEFNRHQHQSNTLLAPYFCEGIHHTMGHEHRKSFNKSLHFMWIDWTTGACWSLVDKGMIYKLYKQKLQIITNGRDGYILSWQVTNIYNWHKCITLRYEIVSLVLFDAFPQANFGQATAH